MALFIVLSVQLLPYTGRKRYTYAMGVLIGLSEQFVFERQKAVHLKAIMLLIVLSVQLFDKRQNTVYLRHGVSSSG